MSSPPVSAPKVTPVPRGGASRGAGSGRAPAMADSVLVEPMRRVPTLATVLSRLTRLDEDFAETDDPPVRPEDTL